MAIDFGRVYLGWVNLQNMARVAANYAANHPTAWTLNDTTAKAAYQNQVIADAKQNNCTLPKVSGVQTAPPPTFTPDTNIGSTAQVQLSCTFTVITPVISSILGNGGTVTVSASSTFPIKSGLFAAGGGTPVAPTAAFFGNPTTVTAGGSVQFTDSSMGGPTSWLWDFGDGTVPSPIPSPLHVYPSQGLYTVSLTVTNSIAANTLTKFQYITVSPVPPTVDFTGIPLSGDKPLTVAFTGTSSLAPTSVLWTFGDGATSASGLVVSHVYSVAGSYTVRLDIVTSSGNATVTKTSYITVNVGVCTVPNFNGFSSALAQGMWGTGAGGAQFTTIVNFQQGGLPWTIKSQTLVGGSLAPCNSAITVSKN